MIQPLRALPAVVALLLAGCAGATPVRGPGPGEQPRALEPPSGQQLVALRGLALAVPDDWETEVFDGCGRTPDGAVVFRLPDQGPGCGQPPDRGRSWVLLDRVSHDDDLLLALGRGGRVGGETVLQSGLACRGPLGCDQTVAVPALGVLAQVHVHGAAAEREARAIRQSLRLVPDGWTSVPPIAFGTSDEGALALLDEAGLDGRIPEVDWPHYVTGSSPPPGAVVERGSVVDLTIGDG